MNEFCLGGFIDELEKLSHGFDEELLKCAWFPATMARGVARGFGVIKPKIQNWNRGRLTQNRVKDVEMMRGSLEASGLRPEARAEWDKILGQEQAALREAATSPSLLGSAGQAAKSTRQNVDRLGRTLKSEMEGAHRAAPKPVPPPKEPAAPPKSFGDRTIDLIKERPELANSSVLAAGLQPPAAQEGMFGGMKGMLPYFIVPRILDSIMGGR